MVMSQRSRVMVGSTPAAWARRSARLAGIEETVLLYQGEAGRPRARHMLTDTDATQRRLFELFGLAAYAPTR